MWKASCFKINICIFLLIGIFNGTSFGELKNMPDPFRYRPHYFKHSQDPFYVRWVGYNRQPAAKKTRPGYQPIRGEENLWAIYYVFVWNGETNYDGKGRDKKDDPEPVIVFVDDKTGEIVAAQTRWHCDWRPHFLWIRSRMDLDTNGNLWLYFTGFPMPNPPYFAWTHSPVLGLPAIQIVNGLGGQVVDLGYAYNIKPIGLEVISDENCQR